MYHIKINNLELTSSGRIEASIIEEKIFKIKIENKKDFKRFLVVFPFVSVKFRNEKKRVVHLLFNDIYFLNVWKQR